MLRRDFIQISTLSAAGLLTLSAKGNIAPAPRQVAVVDPERVVTGYRTSAQVSEAMAGATTMLQESGIAYEVVGTEADFSPYKVLILPDSVLFSHAFKEKIETYLQQKGAVLASWRSGLTPDGLQFATPAFGIERIGDARYSPDFIDSHESTLGQHLASSELTMYLRGMEVLAKDEATILARTLAPLPSADSYPAATEYGKVIYFMHPIFTQYHRSAPRWCRQLVQNALAQLVPGIAESSTLPIHTAIRS